MTTTKTPVATDSAAELHELIGDDATATFENDPKFIDSDPTDSASSENIEVQRDTDDTEDSEEEDDELEDEDEDDEAAEDEEEEDDEELEDEEDDEDEDEDDEDEEEAEATGADSRDTTRVVDAALRMNAMVAVASEYAANA